ncbi:hypothetical protein [Micromonospora coerulea]|uniref:hypothetical protein n=1 Tax=Micromonospora coerulea TaxID=47856 RepID=UPI0031F97558
MPPLLTEDEYKARWDPTPQEWARTRNPPFDFWPYFDSIPEDDFNGHDFSEGRVTYAWQSDGAHQHVLVDCETPNVFLVLVLDLHASSVLGHHLLDLNRLYGLA